MKIARRHPPEPHIPFIALADIAWQIIIFFLVASTFVKDDALKIDVPSSTESASADQGKTITVAATATALLVDGKPVAFDKLRDEISQMLKGRKTDQERAVMIEAHDDLSFQRDAEIMYAIQQAGGILVMSDSK